MNPRIISANLVVKLLSFYREKTTMFFTFAFPIILILVFGTIFMSQDNVEYHLCVQDLEPARDTFMKLAGGTTRLAAEMDRDEFLRQVREYEEVDRSTLDKAYKVLLTLLRTHPFAMQRAKELEVWFNSGFDDLMDRRAARV